MLITVSSLERFHIEVSSFQGVPIREVPLYTCTYHTIPITDGICHIECCDLPWSSVTGREIETPETHSLILLTAGGAREVRYLFDSSESVRRTKNVGLFKTCTGIMGREQG